MNKKRNYTTKTSFMGVSIDDWRHMYTDEGNKDDDSITNIEFIINHHDWIVGKKYSIENNVINGSIDSLNELTKGGK